MPARPPSDTLQPGDVAECMGCGYTFVVKSKRTSACRRCGRENLQHWTPGEHSQDAVWPRARRE